MIRLQVKQRKSRKITKNWFRYIDWLPLLWMYKITVNIKTIANNDIYRSSTSQYVQI